MTIMSTFLTGCSESSQSDYHIESDDSEMCDMDIGQDQHLDVDFLVPDIKANPPKWTDRIESITVPPPKSKGGQNCLLHFLTLHSLLIIFNFSSQIHWYLILLTLQINVHRLKLKKKREWNQIMLTNSGI